MSGVSEKYEVAEKNGGLSGSSVPTDESEKKVDKKPKVKASNLVNLHSEERSGDTGHNSVCTWNFINTIFTILATLMEFMTLATIIVHKFFAKEARKLELGGVIPPHDIVLGSGPFLCVACFQQIDKFRYASAIDIFLMLLGALAAIVHGTALPVLFLFFGDLLDSFIYQAISSGIAQGVSNQTGTGIDCSSVFNITLGNNTVTDVNITYVIQNLPNSSFTGIGCLLGADFINQINVTILVFVGIAIVVLIVAWMQICTYQFSAERQVHKIRLRYYRAIMRQNIAWFDENPTGELVNRLSDDIDKIYAGIGDKLSIFIQWVTTFFAGFAVAFSQEWRLTLLMVAFTPFLAVSGAIFGKLTAAFTSKEQKEYASAGAVAEEVLSSIRTVFAFGGETKEVMRYDDKLRKARRLGAKKGFTVGISLAVIFFLLFSIYGVGFGFGGYLIAKHGAEGGNILAVFFSVIIGALSLGQAAPNLENLLTAAGAAITVYDTIDKTPPIDSSSEEGAKPEKLDPTIQLKNVNFTYPSRPDVQVMHDVSLRAEVGQTVALVGPSGCGKSTVVQLIQRFYDVDGGEVLVGGVNVKELNLKWLRSQIGVVSQEPVLFDTTIAENICYGREDATLEDIQEAAKKANAHDFITSLPKGYDTNVGEGGTQLSGGQKQRVAIARALVSNPKILLLDEATSALDTESEAVVQEALDKAREGRTTIVIAHRLSTIQNADTITSIDSGRVVEAGTHAELMDLKGLYHELVEAQSFGTDELFIESKSLGRLFSHQSSKMEAEQGGKIGRQTSYQHQASAEGKEVKRVLSLAKKEEEWDKDIPSVPLHRVLALNAKEWWIIILGVIGAAVNGCIFPVFAIIFGEIIFVFSLDRNEILSEIGPWAGLLVVLGAVSGCGIFLKTFCFTVSGENLTSRLRSRLFKAFLRQEIGWYDDERNSTGALTTRLAHDAGQVQGATGSRVGSLIEVFIGLFLALLIAFIYSWLLTLVILGVVPLIIIAGSFQLQVFTKHASKTKKNLETAGKLAVDSIDNIRTVASLAIEDRFYSMYSAEVTQIYKSSVLIHPPIYGITYSFSQAIIYIMYAVVFRFGAFLVIQDPNSILSVDFNDIFRVFMAVIFGAFSVGQASAFAPNYAKAKLSANRIFAMLDRKPEIDNYSEEGQKLEKVSGAVSVDDVHFSYPTRSDVPVLQGLSVNLSPGKTLALVGPSGCGKSTIVSLIERFYDPSSGSVKLEGVDIRDLNISWLRSQIGIVSQEPVLFDNSIAENIRYGALFREVSDDEVLSAAKAANIHSFIETLPQGYSTNVGAKGTQLSGGQKQRIAIARALVRDPKVLLLDEATSALDTESEKVVQEALDKAREGRTTIIIAHRLSTVYNSDTIAVIQGGKVLESGTHSELLASKGLYYKLNRFQIVKEAVQEGEGDGEVA